MSVFELECAEAASGVVCAHIHEFYPSIVGDPVVFYVIDPAELPVPHTVLSTPSESGDECHREIDVGKKPLYKAFRDKRGWENFQTCDNGVVRPMTLDDVKAIVEG